MSGTALVEVSYPDSDPKLAATIVKQYAGKLAAKRNQTDRKQVDAADRVPVGASRPERDRRGQDRRPGASSATPRWLRSTWPLTRVDTAPAVVTTSGPPLSRQVMLALGLLLGLALGTGGRCWSRRRSPRW